MILLNSEDLKAMPIAVNIDSIGLFFQAERTIYCPFLRNPGETDFMEMPEILSNRLQTV